MILPRSGFGRGADWVVLVLFWVLGSVLAKDTAFVEVVLFESSPNGDYTTYTTGLQGRFSRAGATISAEGDIVQVRFRLYGCTCMGIWRFLCGAFTLCNFVFLSLRGCGVALHCARMMVQAQRTMRSQNGFLSRKTCKRTCKKVTWMHNLHEWCSCVLQKRTRNVQKQTRCILCSADDSGKHMSKVINFNNCISQIFCSVVMPVLLSTNRILTINENVERSRIYKRRISKPGNY